MWRLLVTLLVAFAFSVTHLSARGGGGCVATGTLIDTPSGPRAIESLRVGNAVWSQLAGRRIEAIVQAVYAVEPEEFIELTTVGQTLLVTPEHPVETAPGEFARADQLTAATVLCTESARAPLVSLRRLPADRLAYNLLVSPGGVFFANSLLVHNKGCFLPDTPISLADGGSRAIGEIHPGDPVLAFNPNGAAVSAVVHQILTHEVSSYLIVRTATTELHVTEEHPFYVGAGVFKTIESLHVGDAILAFDGAARFTPQRILAMERRTEKVTVYNLEVDAPHTFIASGIAVHNKGGGCFAPGTSISTPLGLQSIETLQLGDLVLAAQPDGRVKSAAITGVYLNFSPSLVLHTNRGTLQTTDEHPLLTARGEFIAAGQLNRGTNLQLGNGKIATIDFIERRSEPGPVYTLQVDGAHTFIADGFVVHNKGGSSGGFHSSGYHSSGSGDGSPPNPLVMLVLAGVVVIVIIVRIREAFGSAGSDEDLDYCFDRSEIEPKAAKTGKLIAFIAKVDDTVSPEHLMQTVSDTFGRLQECWQAREYAPMQPLLMPDLYEQHCAQLRGLKQTHEINRIENPSIESIDLIHLNYTDDKKGRWFAALITAWLRDYYVDDRTGGFLRGDESAARFQEFWIFQFHEGSWRLREIEQSRESDLLRNENFFESFTETGRDQVYGKTAGLSGPSGPNLPEEVQVKDANIDRLLNFLVKTDRIWDREAMLATARRLYPGVLLAWQDGRPEAFTGIAATPEMLAHWRSVNEANQLNHWRVEYRNLCVRKIEIVHVNNRHERGEDEFTARISAHAQVISTQNGIVRHQDEFVRPWIEFWTFSRDSRLWKLKEILPAEKGAAMLALENTDESSSTEMLQWYYSKERAT